jgi:predicted  nucleic acid-binding Zn-ribbon protein
MTEELTHLWHLSLLDEERLAEQTALNRIPARRQEAEHKVAAERAKLDAHRARIAALQKIRREREHDIEAANVEEKKFQSQLPAVKKNEEYQALLHEIARAKGRRSDLETEVLMSLEEEERLAAASVAVEKLLATAEAERAEVFATIDAEEAKRRTRIESIDADRRKHIDPLPTTTRSRYERALTSREGRAVVPIIRGACGGCHRNQPPQILQEARRRDRVLTCDGCGRMVVMPPE